MIAHRFKSCLRSALLLSVALCGGVQAGEKREPIVIADAAFGEVLFYYYQEDYFPAIVRLLAAKQTRITVGPDAALRSALSC